MRGVTKALIGLAIAGLAPVLISVSAASAQTQNCSDLAWAMSYHTAEGNVAYVGQLHQWYNAEGCDPDFAPIP